MIITISGSAGSGKDTTGELLAKKLKLRLIQATLRMYAKKKGIDILGFEKQYAANNEHYDREIDQWQIEEATKGNCVLVSWLSAYNIPGANLKIWLQCSVEERAKRVAKRDKIPSKKALAYVKERDKIFRDRIKKTYGVDFWDPSLYDFTVDTEKNTPKKVVEIILKEVEKCR